MNQLGCINCGRDKEDCACVLWDDVKTTPQHYKAKQIEPIDVIDTMGDSIGFCRGNIIKYVMRAGDKQGETMLDDLNKAKWYIDRLIKHLTTKG